MKKKTKNKPEEKYCYVTIELSESDIDALCTMLKAKENTGSIFGIMDEIGQKVYDRLAAMSEGIRKRNEANSTKA